MKVISVSLCIVMALLISCGDKWTMDNGQWTMDDGEVLRTLAIVAPIGDAATKSRLERTAQWFQDNFAEAQQGDTVRIRMQIEWHDELNEDLDALSRELANRDDVTAIVGPFGNESMASFAPACQKTHKPLIAPTTTSENILRRYAVSTAGKSDEVNKDAFFWPLCESDAALTETMLRHNVSGMQSQSGSLACAVFSPADNYGQTFYDWAPFHTRNMNVNLRRNVQYSTTESLLSSLTDYWTMENGQWTMDNGQWTIDNGQWTIDNGQWTMENGERLSNSFCIVETTRQLLDVARTIDNGQWTMDGTYFVFPSLSEEGLAALGEQGAKELQGYQGFMPYADPSTGFEQAYEERFGTKPTFAECKFYDALLLPALASYLDKYIETIAPGLYGSLTRNEHTNELIRILGAGRTGAPTQEDQPIWRGVALRQYLQDLPTLSWPAFCGASGYVIFDEDCCTQIAQTTYLHWQIDNGSVRHLTYYGPDGKQVTSSSVSWEPFYDEASVQQDFADMAADEDAGIRYAPLTNHYAVLVQGSNGMNNYRHQADVLSVYHLLRQNGFDDDHIILILDGALAHDPQNNEPGIIRNSPVGHDLMGGTDAEENARWREEFGGGHLFDSEYPAAVVDYSTDSLTASDIADILLGLQSAHLPIVLPQDEGTNVLLYWSGHGRNITHGGADELVWRETPAGQGFTAERMRQTVEQMTFRKMLTIVEPCYSEGVILPLQGIMGVLAMAGASGDEQSWAENWNAFLGRYGTWMCDRFTLNVVSCLTNDVATTYRDLYLYCQRNTIGSHVRLVNADHFGNLYRTSPKEFFATSAECRMQNVICRMERTNPM